MSDTDEQAYTGPDGVDKVDWLNRIAHEVRVTDSNRAFALSQQALALAKELVYEKGLAEGLCTLGFCHIRLSRHAEARGLLEDSLRIFTRLRDTHGQSYCYEYLGIASRSLGDYAASLDYLFQSLDLRQDTDNQEAESASLLHIGVTYRYLGDYANALAYFLKGLPLARAIKALTPESYILNNIGILYFETGYYREALDYYQQSLAIRHSIGDQWGEAGCLDNIGNIYFKLGDYQQALHFSLQGLRMAEAIGDQKGQGNTLFNLGNFSLQSGDANNSLLYCNQSLKIREAIGDKKGQAEVLLLLGELYGHPAFTPGNPDQVLAYLHQALQLAVAVKAKDITCKIHLSLSKALKKAGNYQQSLHHFEAYNALDKEVYNESVNGQIRNLQITHRVEQSQKEAEIYRLRNIELANLVEEVNNQKEEIETQKDYLEQTLTELKATQSQLIQKEKMASLGELTAGIAHEIQNPLNFVNNFSEVSKELVDELRDEWRKGDGKPEVVEELFSDLAQNLSKIHHHGQRADSIVKGMLQHSRTSTGEKQATDLNALADEYLRLSYHGLRAKDKDFNASLVTDFDASLGKVEVVPEEIGRVLLNLFNNAFYAVQQKKAVLNGRYEPQVKVSTKKVDNKAVIWVKDNGSGIPESVKSKIFQPFFTTKPTGQGTGLGLSLSYDIITKGHGGELRVDSQEREGTAFIITLPNG